MDSRSFLYKWISRKTYDKDVLQKKLLQYYTNSQDAMKALAPKKKDQKKTKKEKN